MLNYAYFFYESQPMYAYKRYAYKKRIVNAFSLMTSLLMLCIYCKVGFLRFWYYPFST